MCRARIDMPRGYLMSTYGGPELALLAPAVESARYTTKGI